MARRFFTIPIVFSDGTVAHGKGRSGVMLAPQAKANGSIMVPKSGTVTIRMVVSANEPVSGLTIFAGMTKNRRKFQEAWLPPSGERPLNIEGTDLSQRIELFGGVQVEEGDFLAVRVMNRGGQTFNLSAFFMRYLE